MQIVIDMPEDVFKRTVFYREFRDLNDCVTTIKALENAVPLTKGHGRLIDGSKLEQFTQLPDMTFELLAIDIFEAPTIIEADKGE